MMESTITKLKAPWSFGGYAWSTVPLTEVLHDIESLPPARKVSFREKKGKPKFKKQGSKPTTNRNLFNSSARFWEHIVVDSIGDEYYRLARQLHRSVSWGLHKNQEMTGVLVMSLLSDPSPHYF